MNSAGDISSLCEIMVGAFSNENLDEKTYAVRLVAKTGAGESRDLEQIRGKPIFKMQGLPFQSTMLLTNIIKSARP